MGHMNKWIDMGRVRNAIVNSRYVHQSRVTHIVNTSIELLELRACHFVTYIQYV